MTIWMMMRMSIIQRKMSSQGEITHERGTVQVMRNEWRERTTVEDRCKDHSDGTDLMYLLSISLDIESGCRNC